MYRPLNITFRINSFRTEKWAYSARMNSLLPSDTTEVTSFTTKRDDTAQNGSDCAVQPSEYAALPPPAMRVFGSFFLADEKFHWSQQSYRQGHQLQPIECVRRNCHADITAGSYRPHNTPMAQGQMTTHMLLFKLKPRRFIQMAIRLLALRFARALLPETLEADIV
jgi:hypothetical protein